MGASYATWRLNDKTVLGLSLTSPFVWKRSVFFQNDAPFDQFPASTLLAGSPPLLGTADVGMDIISVGWKMVWGAPRGSRGLEIDQRFVTVLISVPLRRRHDDVSIMRVLMSS